jgi:hypothetical protein
MYGDQAKARGITTFVRADAPNDDPAFLDALASIVEPRLPAVPGAVANARPGAPVEAGAGPAAR